LRCRSLPCDRSTNTVVTQLSTAPTRAAAKLSQVPNTNRASTFTTRFGARVLWTGADTNQSGHCGSPSTAALAVA
jgi:hypothetical protein